MEQEEHSYSFIDTVESHETFTNDDNDGKRLSESVSTDMESRRQKRDEEILMKYEQGPTRDELDNSLYKSTNLNRYGFIIGQGHTRHLNERLSDEKDSIKKWTKILSNWEKYSKGKNKLIHKMAHEGIPDCLRSKVWKKLLKVDEQIEANPDLYDDIKRAARKKSHDIEQIDKDVERTLRMHVAYNVRYSVKQKELFDVLVTYSSYDPTLGYCQSMNEVAGILLLYLNEQETFYALSTLILDKIHNLHGFYEPGFPKLIIFDNHLRKTMETLLPKLYKHLDDMGYNLSFITMKWFLTLFSNSIPFSCVLKFWDRFILEGAAVLYPIAFTLLQYHKKDLMKASSFDKVVEFLKETDQFKYDIARIHAMLENNIRKLVFMQLYPIPGVKHDIVNIDLISLLSDEPDADGSTAELSLQLSDTQSTNTIASFPPRKPFMKSLLNKKYISDSNLLHLNAFDPTSNTAPVPASTLENFLILNSVSLANAIQSANLNNHLPITTQNIRDILKAVHKFSTMEGN